MACDTLGEDCLGFCWNVLQDLLKGGLLLNVERCIKHVHAVGATADGPIRY